MRIPVVWLDWFEADESESVSMTTEERREWAERLRGWHGFFPDLSIASFAAAAELAATPWSDPQLAAVRIPCDRRGISRLSHQWARSCWRALRESSCANRMRRSSGGCTCVFSASSILFFCSVDVDISLVRFPLLFAHLAPVCQYLEAKGKTEMALALARHANMLLPAAQTLLQLGRTDELVHGTTALALLATPRQLVPRTSRHALSPHFSPRFVPALLATPRHRHLSFDPCTEAVARPKELLEDQGLLFRLVQPLRKAGNMYRKSRELTLVFLIRLSDICSSAVFRLMAAVLPLALGSLAQSVETEFQEFFDALIAGVHKPDDACVPSRSLSRFMAGDQSGVESLWLLSYLTRPEAHTSPLSPSGPAWLCPSSLTPSSPIWRRRSC